MIINYYMLYILYKNIKNKIKNKKKICTCRLYKYIIHRFLVLGRQIGPNLQLIVLPIIGNRIIVAQYNLVYMPIDEGL